MKKLILLISILALSAVGLVGCGGKHSSGTELTAPLNSNETTQIERTADCNDGGCKNPDCPDGGCNEPDCPDCIEEEPDDENKIPEPPHKNHKEKRGKHKRHGNGRDCPKPRPMPRRPE